jgi:hypothetical protein
MLSGAFPLARPRPRFDLRVAVAAACLAAALQGAPALAEPPLPRSLLPEASHADDEREFPPATMRAYQREMALGVEEFAAGRWAEARALFQRGHALLPNARSFRALGMTAFNLKHYPAALRELNEALRDPRRPLDVSLQQKTKELRDRAAAFVRRYQVKLSPSNAELRLDGFIAQREADGSLLVSVGEHILEVEAPGHVLLARPIVVDAGEDQSLILRLSPLTTLAAGDVAPQAGPTLTVAPLSWKPARRVEGDVGATRPWQQRVFRDYRFTWMAGSATVALAAAALGFHVRAMEEGSELAARCPGTCDPWDEVTTQRDSLKAWSNGLLVGALVVSAGTIALALVEQQRVAARETKDKPAKSSLARR